MPLRDDRPDYLKRLSRGWYKGKSWVHWTMAMEDRATSWLDSSMHLQVRELLVHTSARYHLACPLYCLMPDHAHFLWMGLEEDCDQLNAAKFFRQRWNALLKGRDIRLQEQAYDHVLDEGERNPDAFEDICLYIAHNPQRDGLVGSWQDWEFLGSVVAGFPDLDPRKITAFWPIFWNIHNLETNRRARGSSS